MSTRAQEHKSTGAQAAITCVLMTCALALLLAGCESGWDVVGLFKPQGPPSNQQIYDVYNQTILKESTSADVLAAFGNPEDALLSQTKNIIALAGQKKKGYRMWFNMVTFDEDKLDARRKYVFISDERPKQVLVEPWEGVYFDCQLVIPKDVLDEPYANENARRIAILKRVVTDVRKDTGEIGADNKDVETSGFIVGQAIETVLVKLNESPAIAIRLSKEGGLEFQHPGYKSGRLRMTVESDIANVDVRLGSFVKKDKMKITFEKAVIVD
ncbi:MAG: hypothetical protein JW749_06905 [Sedimentisphaerales bacterium]|nr:hypothetical protein [Sedimentisphaerales bacterium]